MLTDPGTGSRLENAPRCPEICGMENDEGFVMAGFGAQAALLAYQRLLQLNWESWKPEVAEWLHSEDAGPVLKDLLIAVPCSATMH